MKLKLILGLLLAVLWSCSEDESLVRQQDEPSRDLLEFVEPEPDSVVVNSYEKDRVISYLLKNMNKKSIDSRSCNEQVILGRNNEPIAYSVNFGNNQGFVVVSATKKLEPILAYSEYGNFDAENLESPIQSWVQKLYAISQSQAEDGLNSNVQVQWKQFEKAHLPSFDISRDPQFGHEAIRAEDWELIHNIMKDSMMSWHNKYYDVYTLDELEYLMPDKFEYFDEMAQNAVWPEYIQGYKDLTVLVITYDAEAFGGVMLKTHWDQVYPYNQSFVGYPGTTVTPYAGCGPVALGQILFYHKYPQNINWNDMPLNNGNKTISDFLLEICKIGGAFPHSNGIVLRSSGVAKVLDHYGYKYSYSKTYKNFDSKANESLSSWWPVYVSNKMNKKENGTVVEKEHSYVLDGIQTASFTTSYELWGSPNKKRFESIHQEQEYSSSAPQYHINWGWGGQNDAYYSNWLTAVPNADYSNNQTIDMFYNIHP